MPTENKLGSVVQTCTLLVLIITILRMVMPASGEFIRPAQLMFLSPADTIFPNEQPEICAGVNAAFKEANDADALGGTKLVTKLLDLTPHVLPFMATGDTAPMEVEYVPYLNDSTVIGFAANSQLTSYSIKPTVKNTARDLVNFAINSPASLVDLANVINLRGFINVELPILIDFAYMRDGLHCTDFFILHIYIGDLSEIKEIFARNGFNGSSWMERGVTEDPDIAELLTKFANNGIPHSCIMLLDIATAVVPIVQALKSLPFFRPGTPILTLSFAYKPVYPNPAAFGDMYMTQVVPSPSNINSAFVRRYRTAMSNYLSTINTTNEMGVETARVPNYQSMEGYIAGRLIVEAAKATMNLTRKNLLETIYRQRMFKLEDFSLGPYTDGCTMDGTFPCQCTSGLRSVYMSRVDASTGESYMITDRPELGEVDITSRTAPTSVCLSGPVVNRRAFNILFHLPTVSADFPSISAPNLRQSIDRFYYAFRNATFSINNSTAFRNIGGLRIVTQPLTSLGAMTIPTVQTQEHRYRPFAIAGLPYEVHNESLKAPILSQPLMGMTLSGAPINTSSTHVPIEIYASLADHIHALVGFLAQQHRLSQSVVLADSIDALALAQKSFETYGTALPSGSAVVTDATQVAALLQSGKCVLVASLTESIIATAVTAAATHILTGAGKEVLLVAAEESSVYYAAVPYRSTIATPIFFASILPMWWSSTTVFGNLVASKGVLAASESNNTESPATAKAVYTAEFLFEVAVVAIAIYDAEKRVPSLSETLFASKTVTVAGNTLGPFSDTSCNSTTLMHEPQRQCQCGKGPRTVNVHSINDLLAGKVTNTLSNGFFVQLQGCGVTYLSLPTLATSDSTAIIAGAAGAGGALLVLCILSIVLVFFCSGKSNRAAPKNEDKPFAMVFTDIESSTTLWARDPMGMGAAIDIHHAVLRKALRRNNGYEVKIIGDSFMVAFEKVADATRFSLEIQSSLFDSQWPNGNIDDTYQELHEAADLADGTLSMTTKSSHQMLEVSARVALSPELSPLSAGKDMPVEINVTPKPGRQDIHTLKRNWRGLRVRVGLHFGTGRIQKDPVSGGYDYYGTVVNTAARVEGVGHGGQVLVTEAVVEELYPGLSKRLAPAAPHQLDAFSATMLPLGPQPLRGLAEPIALFQLVPTRFAERSFGPLRLDCENVVDEDDDAKNTNNTQSDQRTERSTTIGGNDDPGLRAATAMSREGLDEKQFLLHYQLLRTLFSASEAKWRAKTLEGLAGDWKVKVPASKNKLHARAADGAIAEVLKKVFKVSTESLFPMKRKQRNSARNSVCPSQYSGEASLVVQQLTPQPTLGVRVEAHPNTVANSSPSKYAVDNNQIHAIDSAYVSNDESQFAAAGPARSDPSNGGRYV